MSPTSFPNPGVMVKHRKLLYCWERTQGYPHLALGLSGSLCSKWSKDMYTPYPSPLQDCDNPCGPFWTHTKEKQSKACSGEIRIESALIWDGDTASDSTQELLLNLCSGITAGSVLRVHIWVLVIKSSGLNYLQNTCLNFLLPLKSAPGIGHFLCSFTRNRLFPYLLLWTIIMHNTAWLHFLLMGE